MNYQIWVITTQRLIYKVLIGRTCFVWLWYAKHAFTTTAGQYHNKTYSDPRSGQVVFGTWIVQTVADTFVTL